MESVWNMRDDEEADECEESHQHGNDHRRPR